MKTIPLFREDMARLRTGFVRLLLLAGFVALVHVPAAAAARAPATSMSAAATVSGEAPDHRDAGSPVSPAKPLLRRARQSLHSPPHAPPLAAPPAPRMDVFSTMLHAPVVHPRAPRPQPERKRTRGRAPPADEDAFVRTVAVCSEHGNRDLQLTPVSHRERRSLFVAPTAAAPAPRPVSRAPRVRGSSAPGASACLFPAARSA